MAHGYNDVWQSLGPLSPFLWLSRAVRMPYARWVGAYCSERTWEFVRSLSAAQNSWMAVITTVRRHLNHEHKPQCSSQLAALLQSGKEKTWPENILHFVSEPFTKLLSAILHSCLQGCKCKATVLVVWTRGLVEPYALQDRIMQVGFLESMLAHNMKA